jgi:hypothetical protein
MLLGTVTVGGVVSPPPPGVVALPSNGCCCCSTYLFSNRILVSDFIKK